MSDLLPFPTTPGADFPENEEHTPLINSVRFGDDYRQECQDGISGELVGTLTMSWKNLTRNEKIIIDSFLEERSGSKRFSYTIPGTNDPHVYICKSWTPVEQAFNVWAVTALFERTPDTDGL